MSKKSQNKIQNKEHILNYNQKPKLWVIPNYNSNNSSYKRQQNANNENINKERNYYTVDVTDIRIRKNVAENNCVIPNE